MKLKALLLASTVAVVAATGAKAADAVIEQEPAPVVIAPTFTWNGAYIGGQIGYGWGKSRFDDGFDTLELKPDGFLGGLYAGYNFDLGNNVVLGIDGDATYNNLKMTSPDLAARLKASFAGRAPFAAVSATHLIASCLISRVV